MKNIETQYLDLLTELVMAPHKDDRTGTGTFSVFGRQLEHDMSLGFPMLISKHVSFKMAKVELLWILQGRTDMKYLLDNGLKYWTPDYLRSGRNDGTLGPVYGKQWRDFAGVDQLVDVLKTAIYNPTSRRMLVSAWAPHEMPDMALPPCHYAFQLYINEGKLDLMWMQRSADVFLGLPYDIAMYGLLLEMIAKGLGLKPGRLVAQLGDCHLYVDHIEQALLQLARDVSEKSLPLLSLDNMGLFLGETDELVIPELETIKLNNYDPCPAIAAPLSVGS